MARGWPSFEPIGIDRMLVGTGPSVTTGLPAESTTGLPLASTSGLSVVIPMASARAATLSSPTYWARRRKAQLEDARVWLSMVAVLPPPESLLATYTPPG